MCVFYTAKIVILSGERSLQQHQEREASAPRGIYSVCELETGKITALLLQTRFATHSGLTEGTVVRACGGCRAVLGICSTPSVLPTHGGLTPAALVDVRLCTAKIVILSGERSLQQRQERGASAPRGLANALTSAFRAHYRRRSPDDTHGGLTEGTVVRAYGCCRAMIHFCSTPSVLPSHGGLTPAALVNVRFCIAKGVISPVNEHPSKRQERGT